MRFNSRVPQKRSRLNALREGRVKSMASPTATQLTGRVGSGNSTTGLFKAAELKDPSNKH